MAPASSYRLLGGAEVIADGGGGGPSLVRLCEQQWPRASPAPQAWRLRARLVALLADQGVTASRTRAVTKWYCMLPARPGVSDGPGAGPGLALLLVNSLSRTSSSRALGCSSRRASPQAGTRCRLVAGARPAHTGGLAARVTRPGKAGASLDHRHHRLGRATVLRSTAADELFKNSGLPGRQLDEPPPERAQGRSAFHHLPHPVAHRPFRAADAAASCTSRTNSG